MSLHLTVDNEIELMYKNVQHAQLLFDLIDRNRNYLSEWMSWVNYTKTVKDTLAFFNNYKGVSIFEDQYPMEIWYKGQLVGVCGYNKGSKSDNHVDIGYWISEDHQGKGIVSRSVWALTTYAIQNANVNKVIIRVAIDNKKSERIPNQLGFKKEGILRQDIYYNERYYDMAIYGLLKQDFKQEMPDN